MLKTQINWKHLLTNRLNIVASIRLKNNSNNTKTKQDFFVFFILFLIDKKEEIWPSPMTKAPIPTEMSKGQSDNTNNATKKLVQV